MGKMLTKLWEKISGAHNIPCPKCGTYYSPERLTKGKSVLCCNCGVNLTLPPEEAVMYRMSEAMLANRLKVLKIKTGLSFCLTGVLIVASYLLFSSTLWFLGFFAAIAAVFCYMTYDSSKSQTKGLLADNIVKDVITEVFGECTYDPHRHLPDKLIREAAVISDWNTICGSDLVIASYKGHNVQFSDVGLYEVEHRTDSNGDDYTHTTTRFMGQWLVCELNRTVPAKLRLREMQERGSKVGQIILGERVKLKSDVQTDNSEFNKRFQILTEDPQGAFYILTPNFMEFIIKADDSADTRTYLSFLDNRVHILTYNQRDSFEIGKKDSVNLDTLRARMKNELKYITAVLDELLLNEYLFGESRE